MYITIVMHHHNFFIFASFGKINPTKEGLPFGLTIAPGVCISFTKHVLFLCWQKGCHIIIIYLRSILMLICYRHAGKRAQFLVFFVGFFWAMH